MEKPFEIQYRHVVYIGDKVERRTKWLRWSSYKTLNAVISAWSHYKDRKHGFWIDDKFFKWQYRAVDLRELKTQKTD